MATKEIPLSLVSINPKNPRSIAPHDFDDLVKSLKHDPEIMTVNPLVVHSRKNMMLLAGEQRYKALLELGYETIPSNWIIYGDTLTEEQREKFVLLDNNHSGVWDIQLLNDDWGAQIKDWGIKLKGVELNIDIPDLLPTEPASKEPSSKPSATHDDYAVFELTMLHDNKTKLTKALNFIKEENNLEKLEDAMMWLIEDIDVS
ncbi:MAG TPA: hypothetical protein DCQ29_01975 [Chitinophagaceae bacterium]|nr:hypothetical protein [Chitinophagaceae bacterium]